MATTSIWRVKGWLGKVVIYVENPDKTENPAFYEKQEMTERQAQGLSDVIDYAVNSEKTQAAGEATEVMQQFVSGINCHPATAREEMIAVKKRFGKEDGTVAYHGYQSFAPGEATPEMAHEIGVKLAQQLWGDKYQVIVATHLDKDSHLHNHFVVNTVSFLDGLKYHRTEKDYYEMKKTSDALCREYGLSVIENPQRGKSRQYGEWRAEQEGRPTWRGLIRAEIDEVIRQSMTERQFFDNLRKRGYEVKVGKDISVRPPGKERFVRLERNFGEDYSYDGIRKRILAQFNRERPLPEPERRVPYMQENCDLEQSDNVVIYGHHMKNGSMFSDLCKYESEDFYQEHKTVHFDTLADFGEYEIVAAFKTVAYSQEGFKYYHFVNAEDEAAFDEFIAECKSLALYDTGVTAEYGDKLITLSTCEYSRTNGRMVIVAKLVVPSAEEVDADAGH